MKLKVNSWHHRLATEYGRGEFGSKTDFCTYARCIFVGLFFWFAAVMFGVLLGYFLVLDPAVWIAVCIANGRWMPREPQTTAALCIWGGVVGMALFLWWALHREKSGKEVIPIPQIVREAYAGWKEKYCPVVQLDR